MKEITYLQDYFKYCGIPTSEEDSNGHGYHVDRTGLLSVKTAKYSFCFDAVSFIGLHNIEVESFAKNFVFIKSTAYRSTEDIIHSIILSMDDEGAQNFQLNSGTMRCTRDDLPRSIAVAAHTFISYMRHRHSHAA